MGAMAADLDRRLMEEAGFARAYVMFVSAGAQIFGFPANPVELGE